jgi:hypothetical protein
LKRVWAARAFQSRHDIRLHRAGALKAIVGAAVGF